MGTGASQEGFEEATYRGLEALLQPYRLTVHVETFQSAMIELSKFESPSEELGSAAHSMISQAGMFGFMQLSDLCRELENGIRCEQDVRVLLTRIRSVLLLAQSKIGELQSKKMGVSLNEKSTRGAGRYPIGRPILAP